MRYPTRVNISWLAQLQLIHFFIANLANPISQSIMKLYGFMKKLLSLGEGLFKSKLAPDQINMVYCNYYFKIISTDRPM